MQGKDAHLTHNLELEKNILLCLYHSKALQIFANQLFPQLFSDKNHQEFCNAVKKILLSGKPLHTIRLVESLKGKIGSEYLVEYFLVNSNLVPEFFPTHEIFVELIAQLKKLYFFRITVAYNKKLIESVINQDSERVLQINSALSNVHRRLFAMDTDKKQIFQSAVVDINSPNELIPTCFPILNQMFGGYSRKAISSIGGKSGHNKTTFALYNAKESIKQGLVNKILYISADEPAEKIIRRLIASEMGISLRAMRNKEVVLTQSDVDQAVTAIFKDRLIVTDDILTPQDIITAIRDYRPDQTIVDHIQDIHHTDLKGNSEELSEPAIRSALVQFKHTANQTNSNVLILSQVKDKLIDERLVDKRPRPHDFYYSSSMRQECRELCVVYWQYKDTQDENDKMKFEFTVWKSTYSETGNIKFGFIPDLATFKDVVQVHHNEASGDGWEMAKKF